MSHNNLFHFVVWYDPEKNTYTTQERFDDLESLKTRHFIWVHINRTHPDCVKALQQLQLHRSTIMTLTDENTRPRYDILPNGIIATLRGVNMNLNSAEGEEEHDLIAIRAFFTQTKLITVAHRTLKAVKDTFEDYRNSDVLPLTTPLAIMSTIIQRLSFSMAQLLNKYDEEIDDIEDEALNNFKQDFRQTLIEKRLAILHLRRYIAPQKDVVNNFISMNDIHQNNDLFQQMKMSYDYYARFMEDLDVMRERLQVLLEEIRNNISETMNRNLYVLSIVTIIFIPASFLTGLFGINIGGMPGTDDPSAFWIFSGLVLTLCVIEYVLLRRLRLI